jgi:hypothetical protein
VIAIGNIGAIFEPQCRARACARGEACRRGCAPHSYNAQANAAYGGINKLSYTEPVRTLDDDAFDL